MPRTAAGRLAWLAVVGYLLFVAFQLSAPLADQGDLGRFLRAPPPAPRDALENLLLALPIGVLVALARWLSGRMPGLSEGLAGLAATLVVSSLVAVPMELAQAYMPLRSPSWWDAAMMLAGGVAGYVLAWPVCAALGRSAAMAEQPLGLLASLVVTLLWPLWFWIPRRLELSADFLRAALAPLSNGTPLDLLGIAVQAAGWLAIAVLLRQAMSRRHAGVALPALVLVAWAGLLLSPGRLLSWDALIAGAAAGLLALLPARGNQLRLVFGALLAAVVVGIALAMPAPAGPGTGWLSFAELRDIGRLDAIIALGRFFPFLAAPLVLAPIAETRGRRWLLVGLVGVAIVAAELVSGWFGGAASATPVLIYGVGAVLLMLNGNDAGHPAGPARQVGAPVESLTAAWERHAMAGGAFPDRVGAAPVGVPRHHVTTMPERLIVSALRAASILAILVVGVWGITLLPVMPYNVRELFDGRLLFASLPLFALFLLAGSSAPALFAGALRRWPGLHILQPLLYPLIATPVWLLLRYAVSAESLHDILGSPVLGWPGDWELYVRFLALAAGPMLSLTMWTLLLDAGRQFGWGRGIGHAVLATMMATPWAIVAKLVVIDMASTDNLIELIAWQHGWTALAAIGLTVALIALNGAVIGVSLDSEGSSAWVSLAIATALLVVASWGLVSFALAPGALDFLLGPQRGVQFGPLHLLLLWSILHLGIVLLLGIARWVVGPLIGTRAAMDLRTYEGRAA